MKILNFEYFLPHFAQFLSYTLFSLRAWHRSSSVQVTKNSFHELFFVWLLFVFEWFTFKIIYMYCIHYTVQYAYGDDTIAHNVARITWSDLNSTWTVCCSVVNNPFLHFSFLIAKSILLVCIDKVIVCYLWHSIASIAYLVPIDYIKNIDKYKVAIPQCNPIKTFEWKTND